MASERDPIPCPVCREVIIGPLSAAVHLSDMHGLSMYGALARLTRELEEARERERGVRDEVTGYLVEVAGTLADMHDGEECRFEGGEGCLACYAQGRIGEMQDALATHPTDRSESDERV